MKASTLSCQWQLLRRRICAGLSLVVFGSGSLLAQPAALTVTGVTAADKVYDRTSVAILNTASAALVGVADADVGNVTLVTAGATGTFPGWAVGPNQTVTVSGLALAGPAAANYVLTPPTTTATINPATLTVSGVTASDKTYDGTNSATINTQVAQLVGVKGGDNLVLDRSAVSGAFTSPSAGPNKSVVVSGLALAAADAGNYVLTAPTVTANIAQAIVSTAGVLANNKVYDGTNVVTLDLSSASTVGVVGAEVVTLDASAATAVTASSNVGHDLPVTVTGLALAGATASNYLLTPPTPTVNIRFASLTVIGLTANDRTYDGTTAVSLNTGAASLAGVIGADNVTLDVSAVSGALSTPEAGPRPVAVTGLGLGGPGAGNYILSTPTPRVTILPAPLHVTGITANGRSYDGTIAATVNTATTSITGVIGADQVALGVAGATGVFSSSAVGSGKTVTVNGLTLSGADAGNYAIVAPTTTANIGPKSLSVTGVVVSPKIYDATVAATLTYGSAALGGVVNGDTVSLDSSAGTAVFASAAAGANKAVTVTGLALGGASAGNYTLAQPTVTGAISPRSLTVAGVSAYNKSYDGGNVAPVNCGSASLVGVLGSDVVNLVTSAAVGSFGDSSVGTKTLTVNGLTLLGADAGNYQVTPPTATATIAPKGLAVSGVTANSKTYDGSTAATLNYGSATLSGVVSGEIVYLATANASGAFSSPSVGTNKPVTMSGLAIGGSNANNYMIIQPAVTGAITSKSLTVSGISVASKIYDGGKSATLTFTGAALVGVVGSDAVNLVTAGATGAFSSASAGATTVVVSGLALAGVDAGNYSLTSPSIAATIAPAAAALALSNLSQTYDGQPKAIAVTTTPAVTTKVVYGGSNTAPVDAGTYAVTATVTDANYAGSATATLTVAKASQTITFGPVSAPVIGTPTTLSATSSSGLPVVFTLVSGNATLSGSTVTVGDSGAVTVSAAQAGNNNYNAATPVSRTLGSAGKLAQTITFSALASRKAGDAPFTVSSTSSAGLPITYSVVSGPAVINGNTVTLLGSPGTVVLKATQGGDTIYDVASASQSFVVAPATVPFIYIGTMKGSTAAAGAVTIEAAAVTDSFAVEVAPDYSSGTFLGFFAATNEAFVVTFTPDAQGNFVTTDSMMVPQGAGQTRVFRGNVAYGLFTASIDGVSVSFSASVLPPTGSTAAFAGYYAASSTGSGAGTTYSVVGPAGQAYQLAITPSVVDGHALTVATDGTFSATTAASTALTGAFDSTTSSVTSTITTAGQTAVHCSGSRSSTTPTDRLVNLSTRSLVGGAGRTLNSGFVIAGTNPKQVLIRAVGPALTAFGVADVATNPVLVVTSGGTIVAQNTGWSTAANASAIASTAARVGAFGLVANSNDSAVLVTLSPGAYNAQITSAGSNAVAMLEIYDASTNPGAESQQIVNVSTIGLAGGGEGALIGGFVITGNTPKTVLVRGVGTGLGRFGVTGVLTDPIVTVYQGSTQLAQNDNWDATVSGAAQAANAASTAGAFALVSGSKDAAVILTLVPGAYTAQVSGVGGATGTALVEIYQLP